MDNTHLKYRHNFISRLCLSQCKAHTIPLTLANLQCNTDTIPCRQRTLFCEPEWHSRTNSIQLILTVCSLSKICLLYSSIKAFYRLMYFVPDKSSQNSLKVRQHTLLIIGSFSLVTVWPPVDPGAKQLIISIGICFIQFESKLQLGYQKLFCFLVSLWINKTNHCSWLLVSPN